MPEKRSIHRWLFGLAIVLAVTAVPHAVMVYMQHLPTAFLNLQGFAALALGLFAESRRLEAARRMTRSELKEIVSAAEHARH